MIISSSVTIGQITFILRVAVQILAYVGLGLISVIILASVGRVAPIDTHDTINRIVGASTATPATLKWIFQRIRHKHSDPFPSTRFLYLLFLSISYTIFVSISDIGFLGFYACQVPSPNTIDFPASVNSHDAATNLVVSNMVNGTDLSKVKAYRCDSSTVVSFGDDIFQSNCTSWHNSTYADSAFLNNVNSTDSDSMMPRQLTHYTHPREAFIDLNSFYLGPNTQRLTVPTIENGLAIQPHKTGVQMVMGVPQLGTSKKVDIAKTLAVEVEVGCMTLGVRDIRIVSGGGSAKMSFGTKGNWRKYTGPDYMEDVLSKTVDDIRAYLQPFFDPSTLDENGYVYSINSSNIVLSAAANVDTYELPSTDFASQPSKPFIGNCTQALQKKLGITADSRVTSDGDMCGLLGVGGSLGVEGINGLVFNRMVCASATQVNLVDATVDVNAQNEVSMHLTRLSSDLNYVLADYWDATQSSSDTVFMQFLPYQRYTLSPNPNSPTSHFIHHRKTVLDDNSIGPGSAGNVISSIGHHILGSDLSTSPEYAGLALLDDGLNHPDFNASEATKWVGQVGGSYFLASLGYSGWAALQSPSMQVVSTGGLVGSCYKPYYAIGFVPLIISAVVLLTWMLMSILSGSWFGTKVLETAYGGVTPYTAVACPGAPPKETLLAWEAYPQPRLQVIQKGYPLTGEANATALNYLKSAPTYS